MRFGWHIDNMLFLHYELNSIVVNKGRIQGEIWEFWEIFWNSIKLDDELSWEIKDFDRFKKRTQRWIQEIKNYSIWIKIRGEIKAQIR